jgi:hypothetical protein
MMNEYSSRLEALLQPVLWIRLRIRIKVISWIRILINLQVASQNVENMILIEHIIKVLNFYLEAWIRIRIRVKGRIRKVKGRIQFRIKVTSRIRISIKVMRIHNNVCNIIAPNLQMHLHDIHFAYTYK